MERKEEREAGKKKQRKVIGNADFTELFACYLIWVSNSEKM
jgi:hypothetical protein